MKTLRQIMIDQMELRNFSPKTHQAYLGAIKGLASHYNTSPEKLNQGQVQDYLLHLKLNRGLAPNSCNVIVCACKFLYSSVLEVIAPEDLKIPRQKVPRKLPQILSIEEIQSLIMATRSSKHRTFLMLLYGTGLRLSEGAMLKVSDVDSKKMIVRVRNGKGRKERQTILSENLLVELRSYFSCYQPSSWLFYGKSKDVHLPPNTGQKIFYNAKKRAGLKKEGGIHTLRHSFATHMLDSGVDLRTIQSMMGHSSLMTTMIYLHVSTRHLNKITSPLDRMNFNADGPFSNDHDEEV